MLQKNRTLILGASYLLLALVLTWPTARHFSSHLPGDGGDDPAIAWNLWWVKHAILNEGQNPFYSDFMFYPIGVNLAFYTLTVLNAVTALPLVLNLGVVGASNFHLFFTFVVGGYGTFLLIRYLFAALALSDGPTGASTRPDRLSPAGGLAWLSAAVAGGFYVFASSKLFYVALGQFNIASSHWVPFAVLYVIRAHHRPDRLKNAFMAGLFLAMQAWTELTYASFLLVFIALYWIYWLIVGLTRQLWPGTREPGKQPAAESSFRVWPALRPYLKTAGVMGLTFALGLTPILAQMLPDLQREGDFMVEGGGFADVFSADVLGYLVPTMHHPVLGHLVGQTGISAFDKGQHIYLGYVLLGLALITLLTNFRQLPLRFWFIAIATFALLALGPVITVNGQPSQIEGPFTIFQNLPFFKGNRYPSRYSVMLLLSLSVVAGFGLATIGTWANRNARSRQRHGVRVYWPLALIAGLFLFEHMAVPLPLSDMRLPAAYKIIAADPEDSVVLDIPIAWRNGFRITGALTTQFMFGQFYQTAHQKRLLQGNTSRNPEFKFQYFTRAPIVNSILALETGKSLPPERWEADRVIAADVLRFFDIGYIVVRPQAGDNARVTPQATSPYIEDVLPVDKIHDEPGLKIYRVRASPKGPGSTSPLRLDSRSPLAPLVFGEGWGLLSPGQPAAALRQEVRLLLPLTNAGQRITLRMRLPDETRVESRSMQLALNGWLSVPQQLSRTWHEYAFDIPAGVADDGLNDLRLRFSEVTASPWPEPRTPTVEVTVLSAGEEVGGFGHIYVNGHDVSPNQRGYNVAVIQTRSTAGQKTVTVEVDSFDTHLDPHASADLAGFLTRASSEPEQDVETIIAIAAADEASANLSDAAGQSLQQSTGATGDLRGCFRCSQAIISTAGPSGSSLVEALDPLRPVGVTTGLGLTEPRLAAVVDWIRVDASDE